MDALDFFYNKIPIQLCCTSKDDIMYKSIETNLKFYEERYLKYIHDNKYRLFKNPESLTIIDVGANIGNHSIFFSKIMGANVFAFEPQIDVFDILKHNIQINEVQNKVVARNIGISAKNKNITILKSNVNMCGSTEWWYDILGKTKSLPLDHIFKDKIDLIKIDVQGMEIEVLKGASKLIKTYRPIIMIEITKFDGVLFNQEEFDQWMIDNDYKIISGSEIIFKNNTYLIGPKTQGRLHNDFGFI